MDKLCRRTMLTGAVVALPAVAHAKAPAPHPMDVRVLRWAALRDHYRALANQPGFDDPDRINRLMRISTAYDSRVWAAPCTSIVIAQAKLESMAKIADDDLDPAAAKQLRHVATSIGWL